MTAAGVLLGLLADRESLPVHAACAIFPELGEADVAALGEDNKAHGLLVRLVLYQGKRLDGRTRRAACGPGDDSPELVAAVDRGHVAVATALAEQTGMVAKGAAEIVKHAKVRRGKANAAPLVAAGTSETSTATTLPVVHGGSR